jgi:hypothetical protein
LSDWADAMRENISAQSRERRAKADPECRICRGRGETSGYIAPSKSAVYACPCTGMADWQRDGTPETAEPSVTEPGLSGSAGSGP